MLPVGRCTLPVCRCFACSSVACRILPLAHSSCRLHLYMHFAYCHAALSCAACCICMLSEAGCCSRASATASATASEWQRCRRALKALIFSQMQSCARTHTRDRTRPPERTHSPRARASLACAQTLRPTGGAKPGGRAGGPPRCALRYCMPASAQGPDCGLPRCPLLHGAWGSPPVGAWAHPLPHLHHGLGCSAPLPHPHQPSGSQPLGQRLRKAGLC